MNIFNKCRKLFPRFVYSLLTDERALRTWYCPWKNNLLFFEISYSKEFLNIPSVINFPDIKAFPWKIFSRILLIWLSLVKLYSLEILIIIETRTLISAKYFKIILINFSKFIVARWILSQTDSWRLNGSSPNPWK